MAVAYVLSGGGSRGDFQLGAMLALRDKGISPGIICGTSIGSLNGLLMAQEPSGLDELASIWYGLRRNDHMWRFEDWWVEVHPSLRSMIVNAINGSSSAVASEPWAVHSSMFFGSAIGTVGFGPGGMIAGALAGAFISGTIQNVTADAIKDAFRIVGTRARALTNLGPVEDLIARHFKQDRFDAWVAGGGKLRMATVALQSGRLAYVTEAGDVVGRDGAPLGNGIPVTTGAMASAAICPVFPPVPMAGDFWIDGGHRECMALRVAIELGADPIYVISAAPLDPESSIARDIDGNAFDASQAGVTGLAPRALLGIHLDEMAAGDFYPYLGGIGDQKPTIRLIAPRVETHDLMTIDAALIRANADYGYRVASDVVDGVGGDASEASHTIAFAAGRIGRDRLRHFLEAGANPLPQRISDDQGTLAQALATRAAAGVAASQAPPPNNFQPCGTDLTPGDRMLPGQSITSPDGGTTFIYQTDGNIVLYDASGAAWASGTNGSALGFLCMQRDGNLVCYDEAMNVIWASNTFGNDDAMLQVMNDGSAAMLRGGNQIWRVARAPQRIPLDRTATIRNASPDNVSVGIYKVDDTVRIVALPDGLFNLVAGSSQTWTFPQDVQQAKVVINGRHEYLIVDGQEVVHNTDDRLRIVNSRPSVIEVWIFNSSDIVRAVALPGGILNIGSGNEALWAFPSDIESVVLVVAGREVSRARRGERIEITFDPNLYIFNNWTRPVTVFLHKPDDNILLFAFTTRTVAPGATETIFIPGDVGPRFKVRGVGPEVRADPGDRLIVVNGTLMRG